MTTDEQATYARELARDIVQIMIETLDSTSAKSKMRINRKVLEEVAGREILKIINYLEASHDNRG